MVGELSPGLSKGMPPELYIHVLISNKKPSDPSGSASGHTWERVKLRKMLGVGGE